MPGKNTDPSPMEHVVIERPSRVQQRQALNNRVDELTHAELKAEAEKAGVDTAGAKSKADLVDRVRGAAPPAAE